MRIRCFISSIFSSNIYALEESETNNIWLIDAGYSEELMTYLSSNKNLISIYKMETGFDKIPYSIICAEKVNYDYFK